MKRLLLLAAFALVASLIFAATAVAQEEEMVSEEVQTPSGGEATIEAEGPPAAVEPAVQQAEQEAVQPQMKAEGTPQEEAKEEPKVEAKEEAKMEAKMEQPKMEETMMMEKTGGPLPKSGGPGAGSLLLPGAALLLGSGILAYAVMRRR